MKGGHYYNIKLINKIDMTVNINSYRLSRVEAPPSL